MPKEALPNWKKLIFNNSGRNFINGILLIE